MKYAKDFVISIAGAIVRVAVLIIAIFVIMSFVKKTYDFGYRIFTEQPMSASPGRDVTVTVEKGQSGTEIAKMLEEKGLCRDYRIFMIQRMLSVYKDDIKPGTYTLNTSMQYDTMFALLAGEKPETGGDFSISPESEYSEELNPETDDLTGLESGGVLAEEGDNYTEGEAFEDFDEPGEEDTGEEEGGE